MRTAEVKPSTTRSDLTEADGNFLTEVLERSDRVRHLLGMQGSNKEEDFSSVVSTLGSGMEDSSYLDDSPYGPSNTPLSTPSRTASRTPSRTPSRTLSQTPSHTPSHTLSNASLDKAYASPAPASSTSTVPSSQPSQRSQPADLSSEPSLKNIVDQQLHQEHHNTHHANNQHSAAAHDGTPLPTHVAGNRVDADEPSPPAHTYARQDAARYAAPMRGSSGSFGTPMPTSGGGSINGGDTPLPAAVVQQRDVRIAALRSASVGPAAQQGAQRVKGGKDSGDDREVDGGGHGQVSGMEGQVTSAGEMHQDDSGQEGNRVRGVPEGRKTWLDTFADMSWVYVRAMVSDMVEQQTQSSISSAVGPWMKDVRFPRCELLGGPPPRIDARVEQVDGTGDQQPLLKVDVEWLGQQDVSMAAQLQPPEGGESKQNTPPFLFDHSSRLPARASAQLPLHALADMFLPADVVEGAQRHNAGWLPTSMDKIQQSGYRRDATPDGRTLDPEEMLPTDLLAALWSYISSFIRDMAWDMLPGILDSSAPSWVADLELKKFEPGNVPPKIWDVTVYQDDHDVTDDILVEFNYEWTSNFDAEIDIAAFPGSLSFLPDFIENPIKKMMSLQVGVEEVHVSGRARAALRPMLKRLPLIGAVKVGLMGEPYVDFALTVLGGRVPLVPVLKKWMLNTVKDSVLGPYTVPDGYLYPVDPSVSVVDPPEGVLELTLVEATNVPKMDYLQKSSPFCELWVQYTQKVHTQTVDRSSNPRWGETFVLPVKEVELQQLTVIMWDYDEWMSNDEIGRGQLTLSDLPPNERQEMWVEVNNEEVDEGSQASMKRRQKAMLKAAKPFTRQQPSDCAIRLLCTYRTFSESEMKLLADAQKDGVLEVLSRPDVVSGLSPFMVNTMISGVMEVELHSGRGIPVKSGFLTSPKVKVVASVNDECKGSTYFKVKNDTVTFDQVLQLRVDGDTVARRKEMALRVAVVDGSDKQLGIVELPLSHIVEQETVEGPFMLQDVPGLAQMHCTVRWKWLLLM